MTRLLVLALALHVATHPLSAVQDDPEQESSRSRRAFATLSVTLGSTGYNRVEGLPFWIGPVASSGGANPFRGRALAIVRTDPVFSADQVGYLAQGEKVFAERFIAGFGLHSEVRAIEDRGMTNIDNSLSAFLFHDDYRDYHNRQGLFVYGAYAPERSALSAAVEFRTERHDVLESGSAGSILSNNEPWRFQPMIAEGKVHSVSLGVEFDNRRRRGVGFRPGWFVEAEITRALGGDALVFPEVRVEGTDPADPPLAGIPTIDPSFTIGAIDVRRFTAFGNLGLSLRFAAGGALTDQVLPPQFQHALGGRGSLPGLNSLAEAPSAPVPAMDCGARTQVLFSTNLSIGSPRFYPLYGCDRYAIFQAQLEGYLGFRLGPDNFGLGGGPIDVSVELVPRWIVFFNAGQAWSLGDIGPFPRADESRQYDAGGGVAFGDLGFFAAVPLQGTDRDPKFVVRVGSRF